MVFLSLLISNPKSNHLIIRCMSQTKILKSGRREPEQIKHGINIMKKVISPNFMRGTGIPYNEPQR